MSLFEDIAQLIVGSRVEASAKVSAPHYITPYVIPNLY